MHNKQRPRVDPDLAREWLSRLEEKDDTPKGIAEETGYDVRTVRKYIEIARRDRNIKQAAAIVWRDAVAGHYKDLCSFADKIGSEVNSNRKVGLEVTDPYLWKALRQHLRTNPLWKYIDKWNRLLDDMDACREKSLSKIERRVIEDSKANSTLKEGGVPQGAIAFLQHQFKQWSSDGKGLNVDTCFVVEKNDGEKIQGRFGAFGFGEFQKNNLGKIISRLRKYEGKIKDWPELKSIKQLRNESWAIRGKIFDAVAIIRYRRVVAGHCIYCPQ